MVIRYVTIVMKLRLLSGEISLHYSGSMFIISAGLRLSMGLQIMLIKRESGLV